jgi:LytR cell envelope-related transcriptional attenuator
MSTITPSRRRRSRPIWLTIVLVIVGMAVLFGVGFGIATLLKGGDGSLPPEESIGDAAGVTTEPLPCETILVTPAEVLPRTARVAVNVFNSTQTAGLAGDTAETLKVRGFTINKVANDPGGKVLPGVGEIRFGAKGAAGAQLLTYYFPGAVLVDDGRNGKRVDVSLGSGFVEIPTDAEVAAALAAPSPSPSGPGCVSPTPAPEVSAPADAPAPSPSP